MRTSLVAACMVAILASSPLLASAEIIGSFAQPGKKVSAEQAAQQQLNSMNRGRAAAFNPFNVAARSRLRTTRFGTPILIGAPSASAAATTTVLSSSSLPVVGSVPSVIASVPTVVNSVAPNVVTTGSAPLVFGATTAVTAASPSAIPASPTISTTGAGNTTAGVEAPALPSLGGSTFSAAVGPVFPPYVPPVRSPYRPPPRPGF